MNAIVQSQAMQSLPVYAASAARQQLVQQLKDVAGGRKVRRITAANGKFTIHQLGADPLYTPQMGLVVIAYAPSMSRSWYGSGYDPKTAGGSPPDCSSFDGKTPNPKSKMLQSQSCQTCSKAQKTDRLVNGQMINSAECGMRYRIILAEPSKLGQPGNLYRMDMNATSFLAQESVDAGKFAFNNLLKWFAERNAAGQLVLPQNALLGFTFPNRPAAQGHFQVEILQWLPEEMAAIAENLATSPEVLELLYGDEYLDEAPAAPAPAPVAFVPQAQAIPQGVTTQPGPAPVSVDVQQAAAPVAPAPAPVGRPRSRRAPPEQAPAQVAAPAPVAPPVAPAPAPVAFGGGFGAAPAPQVAAPIAAPVPAPQPAPAPATGAFNPFAGFGNAV